MRAKCKTEPDKLTVGCFLRSILPRLASDQTIPGWPADVFALVGALLAHQGAYCPVLTDWPPPRFKRGATDGWAKFAQKTGREWRSNWINELSPPDAVLIQWQVITTGYLDLPLADCSEQLNLWQAALQLMAFADEASHEVGFLIEKPRKVGAKSRARSKQSADEKFLLAAIGFLLNDDGYGATVCSEVHPSRMRVLPKMHTPKSGLTIRSMSQNLALAPTTEVTPTWNFLPSGALFSEPVESNSINLLLLPWPQKLIPTQFRKVTPDPKEMVNMPVDKFGFFTFRHGEDENAVETFTKVLVEAQKEVGPINGIVLPELAVSPETCNEFAGVASNNWSFLVCGHGESAEDGRTGRNCAEIVFPRWGAITQSKHHRWRLESSQITMYGIASRLNQGKSWWEYICVNQRDLVFSTLGPELTLAVLICEDLARPDPVGELLRAVGPNLIIALLMDGPQLRERWSSRYAMVLADDPGSSVLALTSLGMAELSRPITGGSKSRVVALWKDGLKGSLVEIELPEGAQGLVLTLTLEKDTEWTADGRSDGGVAVFPCLTGIRPVYL